MLKVNLKECIFQPEDKRITENEINTFSKEAGLPISDLIIKIGLSFLDTPYTEGSLENGLEGKTSY